MEQKAEMAFLPWYCPVRDLAEMTADVLFVALEMIQPRKEGRRSRNEVSLEKGSEMKRTLLPPRFLKVR